MKRKPLDVAKLHRLYADRSLTLDEIARLIGFSQCHLAKLLKRHGIERRERNNDMRGRPKPDPTPEEIAERAAECRAKHLEDKRAAIWNSADDGARATVYVVRPGFIGTGTA